MATLIQIADIAQGGVGRRLGDLGVLGRGHVALGTTEKPVDDGALAIIDRLAANVLPRPGFDRHLRQRVFGARERAIKTGQEPAQPGGDIKRAAMARAMRPLPSSNGWMVTNHT